MMEEKIFLRYFTLRRIIVGHNVVFVTLLFLAPISTRDSFDPSVVISAVTEIPTKRPSREFRQNYAQLYCQRAQTCSHGGGKVCGYDEHDTYLAEFEDLCTFYKANCHGAGMFVQVQKIICDTKKKYIAENGYDFEWVHVHNSTTPSPVVLRAGVSELALKNNTKFVYFRRN